MPRLEKLQAKKGGSKLGEAELTRFIQEEAREN